MTNGAGDELEALILKAWQGEVYGVLVYDGLARARDDSIERTKLGELVELEVQMRDKLVGLLSQWAVDLDHGDILDVAQLDLERTKNQPWSQLLRWISADAATALDDYLQLDELTNACSDDVRSVADDVIAHERAIISFCVKELAGEIDSLREVRALVQPASGA
ncbi:MAG TPA: hypothetical protein VMT88_14265 [Actinomycetes bacterium]|nr:hypothetical protein [Actinomycetes bacterium]